jgi:hypothetical protein
LRHEGRAYSTSLSATLFFADALGGDRPESNRYRRIHIPQPCH